jgi:hypothetical protein
MRWWERLFIVVALAVVIFIVLAILIEFPPH